MNDTIALQFSNEPIIMDDFKYVIKHLKDIEKDEIIRMSLAYNFYNNGIVKCLECYDNHFGILVYNKENVMCSFGIISIPLKGLSIDFIFVKPEYRLHNIGKRIIMALIGFQFFNMGLIYLITETENSGSLKFFASQKFKVYGKSKCNKFLKLKLDMENL
jgi:ribosomal protein S18 acetylase RimI-like enzyme